MSQNNESTFYFLLNRIESIEPSSETSEKNIPNEDFFNFDYINLASYTQVFDIELNFSISKNRSNLVNSAYCLKSHNNILDPIFFRGDEQEETIQENNSIIPMEIECNFSKERETDFIKHATVSKKKSTKTKRYGRKRKRETPSQQEDSSHGIYSEDNISMKIKTHYLNFIISFLNSIFPHFGYPKKLYKLDKEFKINIKKNSLNNNADSLNDKSIGEIISNKISKKYKSINDKTNANKNICEEIKKNPILNKILSENYLVFFKKFYFESDSYINLKDYGMNKDIVFDKDVKNFKHLLKDNEKRGKKYIMFIKKHVERNYLPGLMFLCYSL